MAHDRLDIQGVETELRPHGSQTVGIHLFNLRIGNPHLGALAACGQRRRSSANANSPSAGMAPENGRGLPRRLARTVHSGVN